MSVVDVDSEKGGSKRPINICRELKSPSQETAPESTDDEVPFKIHSPLEERGSLSEHVNYRKQDHCTIMKQREITCYDVVKEAYIDHFLTFFHAVGIALCTREKKKPIINMQWTDCDFIEKEKNTCPAFVEAIAACKHHGIKNVMELKYDWNDEVILQVYSTLYLDEKSIKFFWMTKDEIYSVSLVRFATILDLKDHPYYRKKLHDDHVMELNRMRFMYEKDEYKLSKVEGFKPFFLCSIGFCKRLYLQGRVIPLGSLSMRETCYMP
jgi:hypothetical protein